MTDTSTDRTTTDPAVDEWRTYDEFAAGIDTYRLPNTDLDGTRLTLTLDDGSILRLAFDANEVEVDGVRDPYDAVAVREDVIFVNLPLTSRHIDTPMGPMEAPVIAGRKLAVVPVLRAGVGMSDGLVELIPSARIGHIGVYRDEQHRPVEYLVRLPDLEDRTFILCDPMVATGYSAVHAVDVMKKRGVPDENILFLALVAAPEGVEVFQKAHPNVKLFVASLDSHLDDNAYIIPGLGDAGDRLFGTKN